MNLLKKIGAVGALSLASLTPVDKADAHYSCTPHHHHGLFGCDVHFDAPRVIVQHSPVFVQPPVYIQQQPVYVQQPPVFIQQQPQVIFQQPQVIVQQQPVYVQQPPVFIQQQPVYVQPAPLFVPSQIFVPGHLPSHFHHHH